VIPTEEKNPLIIFLFAEQLHLSLISHIMHGGWLSLLALHVRTTQLALSWDATRTFYYAPQAQISRIPAASDSLVICFHKGSISYSFPLLHKPCVSVAPTTDEQICPNVQPDTRLEPCPTAGLILMRFVFLSFVTLQFYTWHFCFRKQGFHVVTFVISFLAGWQMTNIISQLNN